jgi:type I restriction enzyme, S subunit
MNSRWPTARLGEVLRRSAETTELRADIDYREVTVRLWGKGVALRGIVSGAAVAASRRFVAREGQFILSRIDARNGAFGLVPTELEGAIVTNDFPVFALNAERLLPEFLGWMSRTAGFTEMCHRASEGTTNRVRLQEEKFLALEIAVPPLAEQRRIVARIKKLAAEINEACTLHKQSMEDADALLVAMAHRADLSAVAKEREGWKRTPLSGVIRFVDDSHNVNPNNSYPNLGIYSFGRGLFHKPPIDGLATSAKRLRRVRKGQFIYSRLFAFEGAYGMVTADFDGKYVSNEYPTFDCNPQHVRAEFLAAYFKPPTIWKEVAVGSKGLGDRRQRVQPDQVLAHELWLPPIPWQHRIAEVHEEVDALKRMQAQTTAELDALLPAILDRAFKGAL